MAAIDVDPAASSSVSGLVGRRGRLAPMAKVEADGAAQQQRLHRQDHLQPLHGLRPGLPRERTEVDQHNCQGK